MISSCSGNSNCKGLTTSGYYNYIKPLSQWNAWTSTPCQGLYIKTATTFKANGKTLLTREVTYLKWIAQYTVPNFGMTKFAAIRDYIVKGTWWTLKEGVLRESNAFDYNLCNVSTIILPLDTCGVGLAWLVGLAGVQVPNYNLGDVERRATSVYGQDVRTVLGRSAQQAGYNPGTSVYNGIVASTDRLRKAWLLKSHLVRFYFCGNRSQSRECLISRPIDWCYGTGWAATQLYAPNVGSIRTGIDEVTVILQSLTNGF